MEADPHDLKAVADVADKGDSAKTIVEKLEADERRPARGGSWNRVRVHRVASSMRRKMGGSAADDKSEARRRRVGDVAVAYRRRG